MSSKLFHNIPLLRPTLALAAGIVFTDHFQLPTPVLLAASFFCLLLLLFIHHRYQYALEKIWGIGITLLFMLIGSLLFNIHNRPPQFQNDSIFIGTIQETPVKKSKSYRTIIKTFQFKKENHTQAYSEKILAYLEASAKVSLLEPGDIIVFSKTPTPVPDNDIPFTFNYKNYLSRQKIYRQVYLDKDHWLKADEQKHTPKSIAEFTRHKLLNTYSTFISGDIERAILSALTLGYKEELTKETRQTFASSGTMHVLAVSGLHVGIIFLVYTMLFSFLRRKNAGKMLFVIGSLLVLWGYALLTGLSPSVMRAATMFSLISIADSLQRNTNIYNSLCFAALTLLIIDPNNLFSAGFQLSFSAVFGIVYLHPHLSSFLQPKIKLFKYFWSLFCVSIAAQLATTPISLYYFGQFPSYFAIANILIVPVAFILIILGGLLLLFSKMKLLATALSFTTESIIKGIYIFLQNIATLPHSTLQLQINSHELVLFALALGTFYLFVKEKKAEQLKFILILLIALNGAHLGRQLLTNYSHQLLVVNYQHDKLLFLRSGQQSCIISKTAINSNEYIYKQLCEMAAKQGCDPPLFLTMENKTTLPFVIIIPPHLLFNNRILNWNKLKPQSAVQAGH